MEKPKKKVWVERQDDIPGYIYLIEAVDFGGFIPGKWKRRCKIGLSRSVSSRIDNLEYAQPPCNFRLIKMVSAIRW